MAKPINVEVLDEMLARWLPRQDKHRLVLDPARLDELRSLFGRGEISDLLQDVAGQIATDLEHITNALKTGDRATLVFSAHRLKNSAGMIGAKRLADAVGQFDARADADGADTQLPDETAIQALLDLWNLTRAEIELELAAHS
jgi:HPt (histidine-containing phosphotransfer) domain-containing protein